MPKSSDLTKEKHKLIAKEFSRMYLDARVNHPRGKVTIMTLYENLSKRHFLSIGHVRRIIKGY